MAKSFLAAILVLMAYCSRSTASRPVSLLPWQQQQKKEPIGANQQLTTQAHATSDGSRPWFCRGLECPSFDVLETSGHLQLRRYKRQRFLVTRVEADNLLHAQIIGSKRLLGYLSGENEDSVRLPPTVPLTSVLVTADRGSETVRGCFYFAIYLPEQVQDDAPKPNNREVRVVRLPRRAVWVDSFDEPLLTESSIIRRGWALIKELQDRHRKVDDRFFAFSLYEPPLPFLPHHYEIAVRARCRKASNDAASSSLSDTTDITTDHSLADAVVAAFTKQRPGATDTTTTMMVDSSASSITVDNDDDDDYPFPDEDGGDSKDDECDDGGDYPDDAVSTHTPVATY